MFPFCRKQSCNANNRISIQRSLNNSTSSLETFSSVIKILLYKKMCGVGFFLSANWPFAMAAYSVAKIEYTYDC